jgi:hypothetical protein
MANKNVGPNNTPILWARDSSAGTADYVTTTNHKLDVNATLSVSALTIGTVDIDQTTPGTTNGVALAQIGSATVLAGNGTAGTGAQRVTIASDNTVLPGVGAGATASAVPANGSYAAGLAITALPTAATNGNLTGASLDKFGRLVVVPQTIRDLVSDQSTTITSTTAATTVVNAVASTFLDLVSLTFANTSATGTQVGLYNDDGTTLRWSGFVPAGDMRGIVFSVPLPQAATNKTWKVITTTSVASVIVTAQFIQNK